MDSDSVCVKCGDGAKDGDPLNHVGARYREGQSSVHPIDTIIDHAIKLHLEELASTLRHQKQNQINTYIHLKCRNDLKNKARPTKRRASSSEDSTPAKRMKRSDDKQFNFKENCFYCEKLCSFDSKHPDRDPFIKVTTKDTAIHHYTMNICKSRQDSLSKSIEMRLLNVSDLVAAEARYHKICRSNFENPIPKHTSRGRPPSREKEHAFNIMCRKIEETIELFTVKEFNDEMEKLSDNIYSVKWTKNQVEGKIRGLHKFCK